MQILHQIRWLGYWIAQGQVPRLEPEFRLGRELVQELRQVPVQELVPQRELVQERGRALQRVPGLELLQVLEPVGHKAL